MEWELDLKYPVIVVDTETTGLENDKHFAIEVAWWNLNTNERGYFIPPHSIKRALKIGDSIALEMNKYRERIMWRAQDTLGDQAGILETQLNDASFAGANPRFDIGFLEGRIIDRVWHHRLLDVSAYAMAILGLNYMPGLADVCARLGINRDETDCHTAWNDVTVTGLCFLRLMAIRKVWNSEIQVSQAMSQYEGLFQQIESGLPK